MPVFDLPQLWERPTHETLLACLQSLEIKPPVWKPGSMSDGCVVEQGEATLINKREVARYLSSIVMSSLEWIPCDDDKEVLWELASRRMSERSGRSGAFSPPPPPFLFPGPRAPPPLTPP